MRWLEMAITGRLVNTEPIAGIIPDSTVAAMRRIVKEANPPPPAGAQQKGEER
jgi:hypothetical protein